MIALLNLRLWLALGLAATLAFTHFAVYRSGKAQVRSEWNAEKAEQARQAAAETLRRLNAQQEIQHVHDQELALAHRDAAAAHAAAGRLSDQLAAFVAAARRRDPAASGNSAPAGDPIGVLADVLRGADQRAGVLAAYADAARIAGLQCERAYDALRP